MSEKRPIRPEEKKLIQFLLYTLELNLDDYPISEMVDEYEGGKMGSIGLGDDTAIYAGDLIQAEYIDTDGVSVVITLTKDTNNRLLDLDFWKIDLTKLLLYPVPEKLTF